MSIAPEDHPDVDPPGVSLHHPGVFQDKRRIGVVLDRGFKRFTSLVGCVGLG